MGKIIQFLIILLLPIVLLSCQTQPTADQVCYKKQCYEVEIVTSPEDRNKGLMFREELAENKGMLFIFEHRAIYPFWMKNTLIPLDMIWIDEARKVVHIESHVTPCRVDPCPVYTPRQQANYVLELNAGQAQKIGLNIGDTLLFNLL